MKKENRTDLMQFRVTPTESWKIREWAKASGLDMPDYLRMVVMQGLTFRIEVNQAQEIRVDSLKVEPIAEGRAKGESLKHATG